MYKMYLNDKEFEKTFTQIEAYFAAYEMACESGDDADEILGGLAILLVDSMTIAFLRDVRAMYIELKALKES